MVNEKHIRMIDAEFTAACEKHPKFCDRFTPPIMWEAIEKEVKRINSKPPLFAYYILDEEIAEAVRAYQEGDREHCLQELAQCGAVILRMMQWVEDERLANDDTCKGGK